jgi:hypothetical protein
MAYDSATVPANSADSELDEERRAYLDDGVAAEADIASTALPAFLTEDEPAGAALNGAAAA